ncbi:TetR/AcrR family transcriptional regulator [soil metagenome]
MVSKNNEEELMAKDRVQTIVGEVSSSDAPAKVSTKDAIYEAALDAFAEKGYAGASLRDIAHRVGVEVASLYNHIDSKESLLFRIIIGTSEELYDALLHVRDAGGDDPRETLLDVLRHYITFAAEHGRHNFVGTVELRALTGPHREEALKLRGNVEGIFRELVIACTAQGYLPADTDPTVGAYQFIALATNVSSWFKPDGPLTADQVADFTVDLITNGLGPRHRD